MITCPLRCQAGCWLHLYHHVVSKLWLVGVGHSGQKPQGRPHPRLPSEQSFNSGAFIAPGGNWEFHPFTKKERGGVKVRTSCCTLYTLLLLIPFHDK